MAVTRIKAYHSKAAITNGLNYITNREKVCLRDPSSKSDAPLQRVLNYSVNPVKTLLQQEDGAEVMVFGHHCVPEEAELAFAQMRMRYLQSGHKENTVYARSRRPLRAALDDNGAPVRDKNGEYLYDAKAPVFHDPSTGRVVYQQYMKKKEARTAYSWVISFPPDKELGYALDPHLVNEIGRAFCEQYLDDYAVVCAQHLDRPHKHLHLVQCAYSLDGTHKYHDKMATLARAREISDQLSVQFGLPIIVNPGMNQSVSWYELRQRQSGNSWKDEIRQDIRQAVEISEDQHDFVRLMKAAGYDIRETKNHYTFVKQNPDPGLAPLRCRDSRLNTSDDSFDYTKSAICDVLKARSRKHTSVEITSDERHTPVQAPGMASAPALRFTPTSRYTIDGRRRGDLEMLLINALKLISLIMDRFQVKEAPNDHPVYRSYDWKIKQLEEALTTVRKLHLEDKEGLDHLLAKTGTAISVLKKQKSSAEVTAEQTADMLSLINESVDRMPLLQNFDMRMEDLKLYTYTKREIRQGRAGFFPMTPALRRELYLKLSDTPVYRLRCKYEEITHEEAEQILDFLNGRTNERPDVLYDINDPYSRGYMRRENEQDTAERASEREKCDDSFNQLIEDLPLEDKIDIDRLRAVLNQLKGAGISPDDLPASRQRLLQTLRDTEEIDRQLQAESEKYGELKRLASMIELADNRQFVYGPLYDPDHAMEERLETEKKEAVQINQQQEAKETRRSRGNQSPQR